MEAISAHSILDKLSKQGRCEYKLGVKAVMTRPGFSAVWRQRMQQLCRRPLPERKLIKEQVKDCSQKGNWQGQR